MQDLSVPASYSEGVSMLTAISLETFLPIVLFALLMVYGLHFGKHRLISLVLGFFIAWPIYDFFPNREAFLFSTQTPLYEAASHGVLFLGILIVIHIVLSRIVQAQFPYARISRMVEASALALSALALLVLSVYHIIQASGPLVAFIHPQIASIFTMSGTFLMGVVGALAVLAITSRSNPVV